MISIMQLYFDKFDKSCERIYDKYNTVSGSYKSWPHQYSIQSPN